MDVAFAGANAAALAQQDVRPATQSPGGLPMAGAEVPGQGTSAAPNVLPVSKAFPSRVAPVDNGVAGVIDRIRSDYAGFRHRLEQRDDPSRVNLAGKDPVEQLNESMHHALKTQLDVLEFGITFHAGLTAAQQGQGGVKTLLEKS